MSFNNNFTTSDFSDYFSFNPDLSGYSSYQFLNVNQSLERRISDMLHSFGIPPHIKGYKYLCYGIMKVVENPELITYVTKCLYPEIAKKFHSTTSSVERAIRTSIEYASLKVRSKPMYECFSYSLNSERGKPTNSEFIATVAERMIY